MAKSKSKTAPKEPPPQEAREAAQEIIALATPAEGTELTEPQQRTLYKKCEEVIRTNVQEFFATGLALMTIRDKQLFKLDGHKSFEAYCEAEWGFKSSRASQLITAAKVVTNCKDNGLTPPANEGQARQLARLKQDQRLDVWEKVLNKAKDQKVTAHVVEKAVNAKLKPKKKADAPKPKKPVTVSDRWKVETIASVKDLTERLLDTLGTILGDDEINEIPDKDRLKVFLGKLEDSMGKVAEFLDLLRIGSDAPVADDADDGDDAPDADGKETERIAKPNEEEQEWIG